MSGSYLKANITELWLELAREANEWVYKASQMTLAAFSKSAAPTGSSKVTTNKVT